MKGKVGFVAALLPIVLGITPPLWAQFGSAIEGTVFDPSGLVVPGAIVTLANAETGVAQNAPTTVAGYYRFPSLPAGTYSVKVEL